MKMRGIPYDLEKSSDILYSKHLCLMGERTEKIMDIAAMGVSLSSARLGLDISFAVAGKAMDAVEASGEAIVDMLESVQMMPPSNHILDVLA